MILWIIYVLMDWDSQLMNCPLDLFVEHMMYTDYPSHATYSNVVTLS